MTFARGWELELYLGVQALGRGTEHERRKRDSGINEDARFFFFFETATVLMYSGARTRKFSRNGNL